MATEFRKQQQRRGTAAEWTANDVVLLDGEIAVYFTGAGAPRMKVGQGGAAFSALPWFGETDAAAQADLSALTLRVDNNDAALLTLSPVPARVTAVEASVATLTTGIAGKQAALPAAPVDGNLLFFAGGNWVATLDAGPIADGSMWSWDATQTSYARIPAGTAGQVLTVQATGKPGWANPSSTPRARFLALAGGATVEAAFNTAAPTILPSEIVFVRWGTERYIYVGAPGAALAAATAADFLSMQAWLA